MEGHPIEKLMDTAMSSIKEMVDVNTIVGDPVETPEGSIIIPVSKVSFGFAAGGAEMDDSSGNSNHDNRQKGQNVGENIPFAGGSGAGVLLNPMAFLVVSGNQVRLLPVSNNAVAERIINMAPELLKQIQEILDR